MLRNVVVFVLLAVPGFILVKTNTLKTEQSSALSKLLQYVGMPFLIFGNTLHMQFNARFTKMALLTLGLIAVYIVAIFFLSKPLVPKEPDKKKQGVMRYAAIFSNCGFLAIHLAQAVYGTGSEIVTFVILLNILTNMFIYTFGVYLVSGDKNAVNVKSVLINPVMLAFFVGIAFNLLNVADYVPEVLTYTGHFSGIVTSVSMTVIGIKLGSVKLSALFTGWKMYYVAFLKLVVFPVAFVALLVVANKTLSLPVEIVMAFFISISMPTSGMSSAFADIYGGDTKGAVTYTLGSTVLSLATIPVLYALL
jgi:predicted permease